MSRYRYGIRTPTETERVRTTCRCFLSEMPFILYASSLLIVRWKFLFGGTNVSLFVLDGGGFRGCSSFQKEAPARHGAISLDGRLRVETLAVRTISPHLVTPQSGRSELRTGYSERDGPARSPADFGFTMDESSDDDGDIPLVYRRSHQTTNSATLQTPQPEVPPEHANMLVRCHEYQKALPQQSTAVVDQMKASYNNHFKKMQEYESATHFSRLYELEADGAAEEAARTKAETEVASAATADRST